MGRIVFCRGLTSLLLIFLMQGIAAVAEASSGPTGDWVLRLGNHTLLVLSIHAKRGGSQLVSGSLSRPQHMQTSDGLSFSHIQGPTIVEPIVASEWKGSALSITVQNPKDPADKDAYLFSLENDTHAQLQLVGVPLPPLSLVRVVGTPTVSMDWELGKFYPPEQDAPSNSEMKRIFDEDQKVRQAGLFNIDWASAHKSDAERRRATMKLLNEGALHSGEDFAWAAFVFQHGSGPNDFLFAHTLAMIAMKKGYTDAIWIASATLDRYLQSIKQPQIYGTQFLTPKGGSTTQEPYNRTLISDALRHELQVPGLAAQAAQCKQYNAERKNPK